MLDDRRASLQGLPSVDELMRGEMLKEVPTAKAKLAAREAIGRARARILQGGEGFRAEDVAVSLEQLSTPKLRRVLNASGVVLHTNLGRAPLAQKAVERIADASGYCNLEVELDTQKRGDRSRSTDELLCQLTGTEGSLVVNNGAAAVLLALAALGHGKEGIVSRGELVEIGGSFRIPDVMAWSGMQLVEVGTTNRTRLADYQAAITSQTALLLKVHRSNFAIVGFTEETSIQELKQLGFPVVVDLGSGALIPLEVPGSSPDPTVSETVADGADLVIFSGDKLLGGPQAGIVVGRRHILEKLKKHPLHRALRVDKLTLAALEATLELYRDGMSDEVPVRRIMTQPAEELRSRADRLKMELMLHAIDSSVVETVGQVGGGSMPLAEPRSWACALPHKDLEGFHQRLRTGTPHIVGRICDDRLLLDVRCLTDNDLPQLALAVRNAC